jgi:Dyp-type peroxidase family
VAGVTALELDDIQGGVVRGYNHDHAAYLFARVDDAGAARRTLAALAEPVTTAAEWEAKPPATLNVALSHRALERLGLPDAVLRSFPGAFRDGMAARREALDDDHDAWQPELHDLEVLLTVHAESAAALEAEAGRWSVHVARPASGLQAVHEERAAVLGDDQREHFGSTDGFGQPAIEGVARDQVRGQGTPMRWWPWTREGPDRIRSRSAPGWGWRALKAGEFVLGYDDEDGGPPPAPVAPFGRNATFAVWRKLRQDVAGFRAALGREAAALGLDPALLGAKLVGRWADGSPLVLRPEAADRDLGLDRERVNDFRFGDDRDGARCPLGAHVRRANPRDAFGHGGRLTVRHRILRRGMPYGPPLPEGAPPDAVERGLVFVAFQADLERQFEVIQRQWLRDGNAFGLGREPDALVGGGGRLTIHARPPRRPRFVTGLGTHVSLRGGEYLWVPGLRALAALAEGPAALQ